jgi:hypothetical protein
MLRRTTNRRPPGLGYLLSEAGGTTGSLPRDVAIKLARAYERDRWRYSPRRLGSRVDRIPLDRPIFLLGTQGASETIIGRCLRRNRFVVSVSGNSDHWTGADEMGTIRNRMQALPSALWGSKHRSDLAHPLVGTDQLYACDALLPAYRRTADDAETGDAERFRRILREHLAVYARYPERARFLDKTHAYTVKIPLLAALLADANPFFVLVVRNPYETCRWAVERKPTLFQAGVARRQRLELLAEHWSNAYATALGDAEMVPNVATVRFEDFMADPQAVVRALCDDGPRAGSEPSVRDPSRRSQVVSAVPERLARRDDRRRGDDRRAPLRRSRSTLRLQLARCIDSVESGRDSRSGRAGR